MPVYRSTNKTIKYLKNNLTCLMDGHIQMYTLYVKDKIINDLFLNDIEFKSLSFSFGTIMRIVLTNSYIENLYNNYIFPIKLELDENSYVGYVYSKELYIKSDITPIPKVNSTILHVICKSPEFNTGVINDSVKVLHLQMKKFIPIDIKEYSDLLYVIYERPDLQLSIDFVLGNIKLPDKLSYFIMKSKDTVDYIKVNESVDVLSSDLMDDVRLGIYLHLIPEKMYKKTCYVN